MTKPATIQLAEEIAEASANLSTDNFVAWLIAQKVVLSQGVPILATALLESEKAKTQAMQGYVGAIERSHQWMDLVMTNAANGDWAQLMEDVGDCLNGVDAVDDESIELWERGKAKANEAITLQTQLADAQKRTANANDLIANHANFQCICDIRHNDPSCAVLRARQYLDLEASKS